MKLYELADKYHDGESDLPVVYIAGPMTGRPGYNFAAFNAVARKMRLLGFPVLNPADFGSAESDAAIDEASTEDAYKHSMARDLPQVCAAAVLYLLPGWSDSRGASMEYEIASGLGKIIVCHEETAQVIDFFSAFFDEDTVERILNADAAAELVRKVILAGGTAEFQMRFTRDQAEAFRASLTQLEADKLGWHRR